MRKDFSTFTLEKAMPHLHLTLFGSFGAMLDGEPANGFESNKVRALLAYLAVESAQAHTRAALAGLFWPECPERQARQCLSQAVYNLRHLLGDIQNLTPFLLTTPQTIQFNSNSDYWLDVAAFTHAIQQQDLPATSPNLQSSITDHQSPVSNLPQAAALYTAPFLQEFALKDGLAFEAWALITRERLHRLALHALQTLAAHHESRGELDEALRHARRAVELDPLWDAAHRQVIHLLAQSGARTQALAQYETLRHTLADALGVEPELETQKLYDRLQAAPSTTPIAPRLHHLPAFLTPFIGREQELAEVTAHLCDPDCRLLTVLGPGGSGKTRFAVEAARRVSDTFPDGVRFVSLAAVTTPDGIIPAVVRGLELYLQENIPAERQVQDYLREKRLLLLLDNYEHLLPEVAWPVQILREAAGVKLLITSRAPLNVKGEHHYPLSGLAIPRVGDTLSGARFSAVQLFVDAAQRAWPQFHLTGDTLPPIVDICRAVEGLPLGVILAAAWVGSYTPNEILEEMRRDLDFLATTWADVPERQRSLRATFAYSWRLLTDPEREVMRALSVFRGGFTREAAREVGGATARNLLNLANKSLIQTTPNGRFYLHELVRQFAEEQVMAIPDELQSARAQHRVYFLRRLVNWTTGLKGASQQEVLLEMDKELANLQTMWEGMVVPVDQQGLQVALEGLCIFYELRTRYQEGEKACAVLANSPSLGVLLQVRALTWQSRFHRLSGKHDHALEQLAHIMSLLEQANTTPLKTPWEYAFMWLEQGEVTRREDFATAKACYRKSLALFRQQNDPWWIASALYVLGVCLNHLAEYEEARAVLEECLAIQRKGGNPREIANALRGLSNNYARNGRLRESIPLMHETAEYYRLTGDQAGLGESLRNLARVYSWAGDYTKVEELGIKANKVFREINNKEMITWSQGTLGLISVWMGDYQKIRFYADQAIQDLDRFYDERIHALILLQQGVASMMEGDYETASNYLNGSVMHYRHSQHLDELGWALPTLGINYRFQNNFDAYRLNVQEALQICVQIRGTMGLMWTLPVVALYLADQGQVERAVEIYALALQNPMTRNAKFFEDIAGREITEAAAHLPTNLIAQAKERGITQDPWVVARGFLAEFGFGNTIIA